MTKPRNTTNDVQRDPLSFLASAMMMGSSGAIEHQEARGQSELVNSTAIPYRGSNNESRKILESFGFKFAEHDGRDLFIEVEMPAGWKKVATDHSMWSKILDDKGRERASIFYKAAFYDRDAFMNLCTRFGYRKQYDEAGTATQFEVRDGETVIHSIPMPPPLAEDADREARLARYREDDAIGEQAEAWLKERYPDYKNPAAYWD